MCSYSSFILTVYYSTWPYQPYLEDWVSETEWEKKKQYITAKHTLISTYFYNIPYDSINCAVGGAPCMHGACSTLEAWSREKSLNGSSRFRWTLSINAFTQTYMYIESRSHIHEYFQWIIYWNSYPQSSILFTVHDFSVLFHVVSTKCYCLIMLYKNNNN